ncbi:ATP-binding protein [Streptomyces sp. NPDC006267]|uniref:ATP-binding protein n=1 Tax=Streptomyces sp. NPDC006267 TaxID=3157173 RepID=UPI00339EB6F1
MAAMLCHAPVEGLQGAPSEIRLQQGDTGYPLDDVIVVDRSGPVAFVVEKQVKRTLEIVPSHGPWRKTISQCLQSLHTYGAEIDARQRWLGVVATGNLDGLAELAKLAHAADRPTLADFKLELSVQGRRGRPFHQTWDNLRTTVSQVMTTPDGNGPAWAVVEETAFRIARRLVVQVEPERGGATYRSMLGLMNATIVDTQRGPDAADVFQKLADIAKEYGPQGGVIDVPMLRDLLHERKAVLRGDPPALPELEAVGQWTERFLTAGRVSHRLGGRLHLEREQQTQVLREAVRAHERVLLTGPAGVGKSALARACADTLRTSGGTVFALSLTEGAWHTVADIGNEVGARLEWTLAAAPGGERLLLVDGAEQVLTDDGALLWSMLEVLPRTVGSRWRVLAVAREQAADAVSRHLTAWGGQVETVSVGYLTDEEERKVVAAFPGLTPLALSPRAARLLRTLYTVDLLVRLLTAETDLGQLIGEEDVVDFVYDHLVRRGESQRLALGHPEARSDLYLELAEAVMGGAPLVRLQSGAEEAKHGLVSDGVAVRVRSSFSFAHDVMQDYAIAFLLCEPSAPDVTAAPHPRRLLRSIRIAAQVRLMRAARESPSQTVAAWGWITDTVRSLSECDGDSRWRDLPFEALFELARPDVVLTALRGVLLADGGRALVEAASLRLHTAVPALPLLRFLTLHAAMLDEVAAAGALRLLSRWLPSHRYLDEELAATVPSAVVSWFKEGIGDGEPAAIALAGTAQHLNDSSRRVFEHICETEPLAVRPVLENPLRSDHMARHAPQLLMLAAHRLYLGPPAGRRPALFREGVWDTGWPSVYRPSVIDQLPMSSPPPWVPPTAPDPSSLGPFGALLEHAPDLGVALAGQILDAATEAVTRIETRRGRRVFTLNWPLGSDERAFTGTARSWQWPWAGSIGPGPALAAASSLRRWAHDQAAAGTDLNELAKRILGSGRSISLAAVTVGVLALNVRRIGGELDSVLGQLDLWELPASDAVQLAYAVPRIVLRAPAGQQEVFRDAAGRLMAEHERRCRANQEDTTQVDGLVTAALLLDSGNYRLVDRPDGSGRDLVNEALDRRRHAGQLAGVLEEFLDRFALLNDAAMACAWDATFDDVLPETTAATVLFERWAALVTAQQCLPGGPPEEMSVIAPMVAVVVVRAAGRHAEMVDPAAVRWATGELLAAAASTTCAISADWEIENRAVDPRAPDRPAAMGLLFLLATPALLVQGQTTEAMVRNGVLRLAGSAYIEVRSQLCEAITRLWDTKVCTGPEDTLHTAAVEALTEMVATCGLSVEADVDVPRRPFRLPDPVSEVAEGTPCVDLRLAASAAPVAHLAATSKCAHGAAARRLADALTRHDLLAWTRQPAAMVPHCKAWRHAHSAVTAELALDGDRERLDTYLTTFNEDPRALEGLLQALADQATTETRVHELVALWPGILDRFASRAAGQLGHALLPRPACGASWTPTQARGLLRAWTSRHMARPQFADHLMEVLGSHGLFTDQEVCLVLDVLGEGTKDVDALSRSAVPFLARVLFDDAHRTRPSAERARRLLDRLAACGHGEALRLQHRLEESSGPK